MEIASVVFNLLGALGVFIYGMKVMSEALQRVAGDELKSILARMTSNPVLGVVSGFVITAVIQSSSATTVMVVSFVNAQLLTLVQSIGVIMGANIGTTVTGWLVALLGFKVKIAHFALPAIGVGFLSSYVKNAKARNWGEVLLGFGLLFLGLSLLKDSVPSLNQESLDFLADLAHHGYLSYVLFLVAGTLLTVVLQSSSATMTLTITFAAAGYMDFGMAAAMVLGENIGTTVTANLAAIGTSTNATRAARAHFLFNMIGVTWVMAILPWVMIPLVDSIVPGDPFAAPLADATEAEIAVFGGVVAAHLAMFHTIFNITNTALLVGFRERIAQVVSKWVPERDTKGRAAKYLPETIVHTTEFMAMPVRRELQHMTSVVRTMYVDALAVITKNTDSSEELIAKTLEREEFIDDLEREIGEHLAMIAEETTSAETATEIMQLLENAHRIERLGDHCEELTQLSQRRARRGVKLEPKALASIEELGDLVQDALDHLARYLTGEGSVEEATEHESKIDRALKKMKKKQIKLIKKSEGANLEAGLIAIDALSLLEEIGDRAYGIVRNTPEGGPAE